jgi:hypothetical protein
MQSPDFYLDTFFNPVWMPGPHIFTWNPDGTVRYPKTTPSPPVPCRLNGKAPSVQKTYAAAAAKSALSQGLFPSRGEMSSSPSVANAEVEDVPVSEVEDDDLVYTWPPNLATYQREIGERSSGDTLGSADENVATAVLCGASPTMSASTGGSSPLITTPAQGDNGTYVLYGSPQESEEGTLEKMTGLKRLRCKAPPPLCLDDSNGAGGDIGEIACILLDRDGERTAHETHVSFSCSHTDINLMLIALH